jgi:hypothetical protein
MARISEYIRIAAGLGVILATGHGFEPVARGQAAIAYTPQVGFVPNGATLSVTPAVSADRRYVRLSVNPYFNTLNGFTTYSAPLAAVGGGGAGGFAGMNGLIGGAGNAGGGMGGGAPLGQTGIPYTGTYAAGDYPTAMGGFPQGFGDGGFPAVANRFGPGFDGPNPGMDGAFAGLDPFVPGQQEFSEGDEDQFVRATPRSKSARKKAVRKPARRPATTKATRSR